VTATLPYESRMKWSVRNKKPIYLADRKSAFSKGIDRLAKMYIKRKFGKL
jgi:MinD-like ATPase involved in chromosome partitioning or flagellar assembly